MMSMGGKAERLQLRLDADQKTLLEAASRVAGESMSTFVLSAATEAAADVLADRRVFVLDEDAWRQAEPATHFIQSEPATGAPATDDTIVKVADMQSTLYIAIHAFTDRPEHVIANEMQRDSQLSATIR